MAGQPTKTGAQRRLLVVDDLAVVRQVVALAVTRGADIELVATAADPLFAMEEMGRSWPDVIILDVEMPRMDGISFLRVLMAERPAPVIVCSSGMGADGERRLKEMRDARARRLPGTRCRASSSACSERRSGWSPPTGDRRTPTSRDPGERLWNVTKS